jgi:hypothetical protein
MLTIITASGVEAAFLKLCGVKLRKFITQKENLIITI